MTPRKRFRLKKWATTVEESWMIAYMLSVYGLSQCFFVLLVLSFSLLLISSLLMKVLKIWSLNINGARDQGKWDVLMEYVKDKKVNVIFLQETYRCG